MNRTEIALATSAALQDFTASIHQQRVLIGFDGFVDSIISVVDQRHDLERYDAIPTIDRFGQKILDAAGQSSNYELVTNLEKLGGNGPIMANAVATAGFSTAYVGALGYPSLHPVFEPFSHVAECHSFCDPGFTDALEFNDGKLMLGKHASLKNISAEQLLATVGLESLRALVGSARLIGMVNWTMLTRMNSIWDLLLEEVLPSLPALEGGQRRIIFIDLADPEKRTREDLAEALSYGKKFQAHADVVFGFNLKESSQVAAVVGVDPGPIPEVAIEKTAIALREALGVHAVVIHPRSGAAAAQKVGEEVVSGSFAGPLVKQPKLSTGAGDNFNAGFCLGLLAGLPVEQALCAGTATSGFYVRNAASPTLQDLIGFCADLPAPE